MITVLTILYVLFISLVAFGFWRMTNKTQTKNNGTILDKQVSVIVAARNESENIEACLDSLSNQNFDKNDYEVIVVNDNSTDNTQEVIQQYATTSSVVIGYDLKGSHSKKEALTFGIKNAKYNIIAATDADCIVPPNWLKTITSSFKDDTAMLLGPVSFFSDTSSLGVFQILDMLAIQGITFGLLPYSQAVLNNGANLSFRKELFEKVKGYDNYHTPSGDDVFLLEKFKRKREKNIVGVLKRDFTVKTKTQKSVKEFIHQRIRWASKSKFYSDKLLISSSLIIVTQNLVQLFLYCGIFLSNENEKIYVFLLLSKWLIDFILLFLVSSFFKRQRYLIYFIPVQLIYPLYVVFIGLASMFRKFEWKGREY